MERWAWKTGSQKAWTLIIIVVAALAITACSAVPVHNPLSEKAPPPSLLPGERWDPVSVCSTMFLRHESTVGTGEGPPLKMVVLGDSILWGQGLAEEQKASTLVQHRLADKFGRLVNKRVYAHSGATLIQSVDRLNVLHGEIPSSSPDISLQVECVPNPEKVDVVLLNGCINDVDASILFDPTTDPDEIGIDILCENKCGEPMRLLLTRIMERFPNANIVLTGYYPFFSEQTPTMVLRFVSQLFLLIAKTAGEPHRWPESGDHLILKSAAWHEMSDRELRKAVEKTGDGQGISGRVVFAPVPFLPENAYGAPESFLWRITEHDNVVLSRWWNCRVLQDVVARMRCTNASAFHPNPDGAIAYSEAILQALEPMLERRKKLTEGLAGGN